MKIICLWLWLLTKRLYKKPAFLAILVLIPVLTFCYQAAIQEESGVMTIALAQEGEDALARQMIESLDGSSPLFIYRVCDSKEQAQLLVATGKADAAWIFPEDMAQKLDVFLEDTDQPIMTVVQREENVAHKLTRERLSGQLSQVLSQRFYLMYLRENYPELADLSDEQLMTYYDSIQIDGNLFSYHSITGEEAPQVHYLVSPVRGMLAVVAVLCGMAAAMYYKKDAEAGTFSWVPQRLTPVSELGCQLVAVGNVAAVSLVALLAAGLTGDVLRELLLLVLYSVCVAVFSMLLRSVCGSVKVLGALMPVLVVLMLLICPVFVDLVQLRLLQFLLPPTYYINGIYDPAYLGYMAAYTAVCAVLYLLSEKLQTVRQIRI